jgi:crotonobetainyl-CoA:carnitine CoA-transferase CaiB-like acyl-CoA transferase
MDMVGRADLVQQPWFNDGFERARHADEIDAAVGDWIGARSTDTVVKAFADAEAALGLVYDVAQVLSDEQYQALGSIRTVADPDLGPVRMPNVLFRMSKTPGQIRHAGRGHGADTAEILAELGVSPQRADQLRAEQVI